MLSDYTDEELEAEQDRRFDAAVDARPDAAAILTAEERIVSMEALLCRNPHFGFEPSAIMLRVEYDTPLESPTQMNDPSVRSIFFYGVDEFLAWMARHVSLFGGKPITQSDSVPHPAGEAVGPDVPEPYAADMKWRLRTIA
jgi:hypothetical protein